MVLLLYFNLIPKSNHQQHSNYCFNIVLGVMQNDRQHKKLNGLENTDLNLVVVK